MDEADSKRVWLRPRGDFTGNLSLSRGTSRGVRSRLTRDRSGYHKEPGEDEEG
jgi:hypothetical protein